MAAQVCLWVGGGLLFCALGYWRTVIVRAKRFRQEQRLKWRGNPLSEELQRIPGSPFPADYLNVGVLAISGAGFAIAGAVMFFAK